MLSAFSMKSLGLALGLFGSSCLLAEPVAIEAEAVTAESNRSEMETELEALFKGKTLPEIKALLDEQISGLEEMQQLGSVRLSVGSDNDQDIQHTPLFDPLPQSVIESKFNHYFDSLQFRQRIMAKTSYVLTSYNDSVFSQLVPDYDVYRYEPATLEVERVHFKDGTSAVPVAVTENGRDKVDSARRVIAVDMSASYTLPGQVKRFYFNHESNASQNKITLASISGREVTLTMPKEVEEDILYVEAIDKQGLALAQAGSSSYSSNLYYFSKLHEYFTAAVKQIDSKAINDKAGLIKYLLDNYPSQQEIEKEHPPQYTVSYKFRGHPIAVTVFLKPEAKKHTYTFTLKTPYSESEYVNGLTVGMDDSEDRLQGLVDEQGNWLITPQYKRLYQEVGDYYLAVPANGDYNEPRVYLLNRATKTLEPQQFYIMDNKIYQDKFVIINKDPNNNFIKGVLNIQTNQIVLPVKYKDLSVKAPFFIVSDYDEKRSIRSYEVCRQSDNKTILSGEFDELVVDGENIITRYSVRSTENRGNAPYYAIENDKYYIYLNYDIYNADGVKLNPEPYSNLPTDSSFGNDGLIPVTDKQGKLYYIDRQAKKADFDLSNYQLIEPFSNGLAAVKGKNNKYGYINTQGKLVIPLMYSNANYFQGGTAMVSVDDIYQLITPDNTVVADFNRSLYTYTQRKDSQEATYTFVTYQSEGADNIYDTYDHKGELVVDK